MEISKQYLDQQFKKHFKAQQKHFEGYFAKLLVEQFVIQLGIFELKMDKKFAAQTAELKAYVHESFETQQDYMDNRFDEIVTGMQVQVSFPALKRK